MPELSVTAAIHQAMSRSGGDRAKAAQEVGMTTEDLTAEIRKNKDLRILWGPSAATVMDIEDTIDRDPPPAVPAIETPPDGISARDAAIVAAHHDQAHKLERFDWEGIGIRDRETLDLMRQFEANAGRGVLRMMDTMQGGMAFAFARVSRRFAQLDQRLQELREKLLKDPNAKEDLAKEAFLHQMWLETAKEMQKFNAEAVKASHMRLLIAARARTMKKAAERMKQGGWQHARKVNGTTNGQG